jgi:hypothetical protein
VYLAITLIKFAGNEAAQHGAVKKSQKIALDETRILILGAQIL